MTEPSIPVSLIIKEIDQVLAYHGHMSMVYAQNLRDNKIDWVSATRLISDEQIMANSCATAMSGLLLRPDLRFEYDCCQEKIAAAAAGNQALQHDLRANCLFNGPKQVAA